MAEPPPYPGTPRWVWWAGLVALLLVLAFVAPHLAGLAPVRDG